MIETEAITREELSNAITLTGQELKAQQTYRAYMRWLGRFEKWLSGQVPQDQPLPPISYELVIKALGSPEMELTKSTRVQALAAIKKLCLTLRNQKLMGLYDYIIIKGIEPEKGERELKGKMIADEEIDALLWACRGDDAPSGIRDASIISLLHCTGMRRGECAGLTVENISLVDRKVSIIGPKNNRDRAAYFNEGAERYLKDWLKLRGAEKGGLYWQVKKNGQLRHGQPVGAQAIYDILKKRCEGAAIEPCTPHDLRRTLISNLLTEEVDIPLVSRIVGHSNANTTAKYDRRPDEEMKRAVSKIYTPYHKAA